MDSMTAYPEKDQDWTNIPEHAIIPEIVGRHLRLQIRERPIRCWHCLLCHYKWLAKGSLFYSILSQYVLRTRDNGTDIWTGYLILTTDNLLFVEEGLIRGRTCQRESMPLDKVTELSADDEIVVTAESYGWSWYVSELRDVDQCGKCLGPVDTKEVAALIKRTKDIRLEETERDRKERKARIDSFMHEADKH